jgi:DNA-binding response OmpR family regulator
MTQIRFTKKEVKVLDLLERNSGRIVTRKVLLESVWGYREGAKTRTVDVHISRLRAKLAGNADVRIHAIAGLGYLLECGDRQAEGKELAARSPDSEALNPRASACWTARVTP